MSASRDGLHPGGVGQIPPHWILQATVNARVVRILLVCILVAIAIYITPTGKESKLHSQSRDKSQDVN